jgi:hypothetical protein
MRAGRPDRIGRTEADQLVSGNCHDPQPSGLGLVLDAVRAPAWAEELADGEDAVTRLVAARRAVLSDDPPRSCDVVVPARSKAVVAVAAALGLLVVGGVAAAETGNLPAGVQQRAHDLFSVLGIPAPDQGPGREPAGRYPVRAIADRSRPGHDAVSSGTGGLVQRRTGARPVPGVEDAGRDPNGAAMDGASWQALVAAAGGRARVAALCTAQLTTAPGDDPTSATPTTHPGAGQGNPSHSAGGRRNGGS